MLDCKVDKPYPIIRVETENTDYAYILMQNYAGKISETTAIMLYTFQHFDKFKENETFSKTLEKIAVTEMRHLEMLGKLIKLLGVNPIFKIRSCDGKYIPWTSEYVHYDTDLKKMLEVDIEAEEKAIRNYKEHIKIIDDKYIKEILERIIEDEEKHLECFKYMHSYIS